MKKYLLTAIKMTLVMILLCSVVYFGIIYMIGKLTPGSGNGKTLTSNGKVVGYELVGQKFTDDRYFWGRPSAAEYNASGSAGSNKGPSNPDYLKSVKDRIDTFLVHHPGIKKEQIPAEMVTASGSGLDPHISPASAAIQIKRIAAARKIPEEKIRHLIRANTETGWMSPSTVHVLQLNIALDNLQ